MVAAHVAEVLIADDDPICREILQLYLENFGCRVHPVCDGNEALALFRDAAGRIGLVILDGRMPGPPPLQLYRLLRHINPRVPVLFCSGLSPDDPEVRDINECGLQLLTKPFNRSDLREAILNVLRQPEGSACSLSGGTRNLIV